MSYHDYGIDEYLRVLCDCESYHICEWHTKLRKGTNLLDLAEEMESAYYEQLAAAYERSNEGEPELE